MLKKLKQWWGRHGVDHYSNYQRGYDDGLRHGEEQFRGRELYTREQLEKAFSLGYNDGKREGLSVAREQATKSLKEILWHQNQKPNQKK